MIGSKQQGWTYHYDSNGFLEAEIYYVDGYKSGWHYVYNSSGKVIREMLYIKDRKHGSSYSYFENGQIAAYNCFDNEENNRRVKLYDSTTGNVIKNEGLVVCQAVLLSNDFTFSSKADVIIDILISTAPDENVKAWARDFEGLKSYEIINNTVLYQKRYTNPGRYKIVTIGESVDTITGIRLIDSIETTFTVKDPVT
jgi:Uncharacterized protein conserved in bacteria